MRFTQSWLRSAKGGSLKRGAPANPRWAGLWGLLLVATPPLLACEATVSVPIVHDQAHVGEVSLFFGEADDPRHPTAWQGPIQIQGRGQPPCTVSAAVALIEQPVRMDSHRLYVATYSGSENHLVIIDITTCRQVWQSPSSATPIRWTAGHFLIQGQPFRCPASF